WANAAQIARSMGCERIAPIRTKPAIPRVRPLGIKHAPNAAWATTSSPRTIQCLETPFGEAFTSGLPTAGREFDMRLFRLRAVPDCRQFHLQVAGAVRFSCPWHGRR